MLRSISHIALNMEDVTAAESYYAGLFAMEVGFRDFTRDGVQMSLRPSMDWAEAAHHGVEPGLSFLFRGSVNIALEQAPQAPSGQVDHIGFDVDLEELEQQRNRLPGRDCVILAEWEDILVFRDRHGIKWEFTTRQYPSPVASSTGARLGRWFEPRSAGLEAEPKFQ